MVFTIDEYLNWCLLCGRKGEWVNDFISYKRNIRLLNYSVVPQTEGKLQKCSTRGIDTRGLQFDSIFIPTLRSESSMRKLIVADQY